MINFKLYNLHVEILLIVPTCSAIINHEYGRRVEDRYTKEGDKHKNGAIQSLMKHERRLRDVHTGKGNKDCKNKVNNARKVKGRAGKRRLQP